MKLLWTHEALNRLQEIEKFNARDNPGAAVMFVDNLISLAQTIPENPEKGRIVPELSIEYIRELLYKNYRIVYQLKKNSIDILTVFESHQLLKREEINSKINLPT